MAVSATTGSGGLDVETLVSQLMTIEKRPLTALDTKIATKESNAGYLSSFKTTVTTFEAALAAMRDSTRIAGTTATSSDAAMVSATSNSGASVADIDVKVVRTAQADRVAFGGFTSATQSPGSGTFTLTVAGNKTLSVELGNSASMTALVSNINSAASTGGVPVKASLVQTSTGAWSLVVAGTETGAANTITSTGPFTMGTPKVQDARDANIFVDGLEVNSASNTISDVVPGVVLQLRKQVNGTTVADASSVTISVAQNSSDIHALADKVVTTYNAMQDYYLQLTKTSVDATQRGPMSGNSSLAGMMNTARRLLASGMTDATGASFRFADMGVELQSDGKLKLNETNFASALVNGLAKKLAAGVTIPLDTYLGKMVLSTGELGVMQDNLVTSKALLQKQRDDMSDRLSLVESSLRTRYSSLDATLYKLNSINTSLTSALSALSNNNSSK